IEKPRCDHTPTPPDFRYIAKIEVVLVVLWIAQRRRLGVDGILPLADIGVAQDPNAFSVGRHDAVLDAVVDHFDEMPGAVGTAVKVAPLSCAAQLFTAWCAWDVACARRKASENRIDVFDDSFFAANHHAIAAFKTPDAAAGAYIDIVNL